MTRNPLTTPLPTSSIDTLLHGLRSERSFVFLDTSKTTPVEHHSLLFTKPVTEIVYRAGQEAKSFFAEAQGYLDQGYYLAGWFAYEFGYALEPVLFPLLAAIGDRPLAHLGIYQAPQVIDHALPAPRPSATSPAFGSYQVGNLRPNLSPAAYLADLERIKEYIAAGDTYQVNYTAKLLFDFAGSPEALYRDLRRSQPVSYGAYLELGGCRMLSLSPELFFRKRGKECQVRPMKGTMPRGRTPDEDRLYAATLHGDAKNRSENVMIVDLLRNDLGRLSAMGGVRVESMFDVETYATLHQMTSTISGRLAGHVGLAELFKALFPCGSVTGAPKIRTMQIIHELERGPRGVYTGAIGYIAPNGDALFNVPIRTVVLCGNQGEMGIGSGIVHDSNPEAEWQECLLKGKFLTKPRPQFQLIETILWQRPSGFWLLERHLERLAASATYFGFPLDAAAAKRQLQSAADSLDSPYRRIRLLLHQDGTIETSATPCEPPELIDFSAPQATVANSNLPAIAISHCQTDSNDLFLYHKTTCRQLYTAERQAALERGSFEVIFTNERGEITEGSVTNIIIRQGQHLYTPPLSCGLLAGVYRTELLANPPGLIHEKILSAADLANAEAIYLINSVRGAIQVRLKA